MKTFEEWKKEFDALVTEKGLQPGCLSEVHQHQMYGWEWAPTDAVECVLEFQAMVKKSGLPVTNIVPPGLQVQIPISVVFKDN